MPVDIKANRSAGLAVVGKKELILAKALSMINQIDSDNAVLTTDNAAVDGATTAQLKAMIGRLQLGIMRNNRRQKSVVSFLMRQIED